MRQHKTAASKGCYEWSALGLEQRKVSCFIAASQSKTLYQPVAGLFPQFSSLYASLYFFLIILGLGGPTGAAQHAAMTADLTEMLFSQSRCKTSHRAGVEALLDTW